MKETKTVELNENEVKQAVKGFVESKGYKTGTAEVRFKTKNSLSAGHVVKSAMVIIETTEGESA
ncbi:hypothetical protein A6g_18370 [Bacillus velezensis]|uniref:hypothetical protein n=1 Tax=Bacillus velezensis TaxID=492670 RepID=UPI0009CAFDA7|nr:hypothetical protein [Bacillus velezensis]RXK26457.1 hypothetical protein A6g_18370 [Bacillus velezensis]SLC53696.1 Uncharacterised protein [Mycobacteroides abscessus subsp. massiliense]